MKTLFKLKHSCVSLHRHSPRKGELIPPTAHPGESPGLLLQREREGEGPSQAVPAPKTTTIPG